MNDHFILIKFIAKREFQNLYENCYVFKKNLVELFTSRKILAKLLFFLRKVDKV